MDAGLVQTIGTKALLAGAGALLLYWTISAVKLVLSARGINPLIKQFFKLQQLNAQRQFLRLIQNDIAR